MGSAGDDLREGTVGHADDPVNASDNTDVVRSNNDCTPLRCQ